MNALATSRLAHWWIHSLNAATRARPVMREHDTRAATLPAGPEQPSAAVAARFVRGAQRWLQRWASPRYEPQTAAELLDYARSIERSMPDLAADLRHAALRHDDTTTQVQ